MLPITISSILFALAVLVVVALFLVRPFFKTQPQQQVETSGRRQRLAHKEALLDAIRILDFDHDTGKLPDEEYEQQRAVLINQAAAVLKELDEFAASGADQDVTLQIEAAVMSLRRQREESALSSAQFCTNCGQPLDADDNFCARCGQPVYAVQPST